MHKPLNVLLPCSYYYIRVHMASAFSLSNNKIIDLYFAYIYGVININIKQATFV